ncbi:MAG: metallophosphoesterase [Treponema sp.]|nr:metallophosphoesterase [Treponema sp.]
MKLKKMAILIMIILVLSGACSKDKTALRYDYNTQTGTVFYPDVSFAVISDTHVYDSSLGSSGAAFEKTMNSDRKLLLDSIDLLDYAVDAIASSGVSFVLISGDLTKDGELINHRIVAERLKRLADAGIAAYVVPGNHDVNNISSAVRFIGDKTESVATVSQDEFVQIYGDFGYSAALMRDDDSLSYVAEPVDGLWLLALDVCRYRENMPGKEEFVSGRISQKTADWIAGVLRAANSGNKAVMAMMHHGVVEHWKGQSKLHPDYLIEDFANFGKFLASWNVRLAFTGHYHAQDITRGEFDGKVLYDVETGSLVTAPCPIRYVEIKNNTAHIRTDAIVDKIHPGTDFAANATAFVKKTVMIEAAGILNKYKVPAKDTDYIANAVGDAYTAHYNGDENPALRPVFDKSKLGLWGRFVYSQQEYILDGLWKDIPPSDNNVSFEL